MPKAKPKPKAKHVTKPKIAVAKPAAGPVLRSLRSVIYQVGDLALAKRFYGAVLGITPYFDQPFYVGYQVAGAELGLDPDLSRRQPGPGGAIAYWKVDDVHESWVHAISNGAEPLEPPHNVGEGTDVAIVADPFGNYVGLIQIEH